MVILVPPVVPSPLKHKMSLKRRVKGNSIENGRVLTVLKMEVYSFIQDISYYKCVKLTE